MNKQTLITIIGIVGAVLIMEGVMFIAVDVIEYMFSVNIMLGIEALFLVTCAFCVGIAVLDDE